MKNSILFFSILATLFIVNPFLAQDDETLSPYFFVDSDDPENDQLPLKSTSADVLISGVIADVTVKQVYKNEGSSPLECKYVFPGSTRAAVYGMKMKIGTRTIEAEIKKKEEARKDYEKAKKEGKRASLLEQSRPNVFEMNVAHIMPGDIIEVELKYTELLIPEDGIYEFVYPTVVGPRYQDPLVASAETESGYISTPYTHEGDLPFYDFDMSIRLEAGLPIQDVVVNTHRIVSNFPNLRTAEIILDPSETKGGNKDFVLNYNLKGNEIESGLMLYEGEEENFFMLMVQPPEKVQPKDIPAREYIFIVDVSGSMRGYPIETAQKLMRNLIVNLRPTDLFNVMLFSGHQATFSEQSVLATEENMDKAVEFFQNGQGGGSTLLLPAMKNALNLPREEGLSRSVVIVTDGYVNCEADAFELIRGNLNKSNFYSFGIGSSVNRHIVEGIANVGLGEALILIDQNKAKEKADAFREYIQSPVLTQVDVKFTGFEAYDVEPITVPDVLAERPVIIYGKYKGDPKGKIELKGYTGNKKKFKQSFEVNSVLPSDESKALTYLWARKKIQRLSDYQKVDYGRGGTKLKEEITELGLKYNLLTNYTSFIAVDKEVVNSNGNLKTVKQALPLPENVSNSAVGFDLALSGVSKEVTSNLKPISIQLSDLSITQKSLENELINEIGKLHIPLVSEVLVKLELSENGNIKTINLKGENLSPMHKIALEKWLKSLSSSLWSGHTIIEFKLSRI